MTSKRRNPPPSHLKTKTADWWRSVHEDYTLEPHHTRLLTLAAEAWDRCQQAREEVGRDGITVKTSDGGLKAHPAIAIERDARLAFARLVRELDLDVDPPVAGRRPPALASNRG
ncbi:MAG: P27 family phage terminase small subunit [Devosia sp.]